MLSTFDAATDVYVVGMYYNRGLLYKGHYMVSMITMNMFVQLLVLLTQYKKKGWKVKLKETLICVFFLRPIVDAYRISVNLEDNMVAWNPLAEMMVNKSIELGTESIWGCVLQIYVILTREHVGFGEIVSVLISTLTTGFTSATIAFYFDVDEPHRKGQPEFYGERVK